MLGGDHRITFRRERDEVRVDPGNVKVLAMKEVSSLPSVPCAEPDFCGRKASNGRIVYLDGTVQY